MNKSIYFVYIYETKTALKHYATLSLETKTYKQGENYRKDTKAIAKK